MIRTILNKIWLLIRTILVTLIGIILYGCYIPYGIIKVFSDLDQFGEFLQFIADWITYFRDKVFTNAKTNG